MAKKAKAPSADIVLQLDPADILADDNIRHSLRDGDVDRLIASIVDRGGIQEPVSVEVIEGATAAPHYRLIKGFYRHAAATKMNLQAAGITVPALVRHPQDETERLKLQVAENVARASLSPIDTAYSIQRLLAAGVSRADIRSLFSRAGVGKAGAGVTPMSNAWLNMHLQMLELPADIIAKIHNGEVSMAAAYELSRVPEERRAIVLEKALAETAKEQEREEKDEEKFLKQSKKVEDAQAKEAEAETAIEEAKREQTEAQGLVETKMAALRVAQAQPYDPTDEAQNKAHTESVKAAETDVKAAQQLNKKAKNKVTKALESKAKLEELKAKLKAAQEGAPAPVAAKPSVGPAAVRKAAQADKQTPEGKAAAAAAPASGAVALTASQVKDGIKEMAKGTENPIVSKVLGIFADFVKGELTPKLALAEFEKTLKLKAPVKVK